MGRKASRWIFAVNDDIVVFSHDLGELNFGKDVLRVEVYSAGNVAFFPGAVASHVNESSKLRRLYTTGKDYRMGGVVPA